MGDGKCVFWQDSNRRKNNSRGPGWSPHNRGNVRLPSDRLGQKEIEALNGDVKTYNLRRPMCWEQFKAMPIDLQREFVERLERMFSFNANMAFRLWGLSTKSGAWSRYRTGTLGIAPIKGSRRRPTTEEEAAFERWLSGAETAGNDDVAEPDDAVEMSEANPEPTLTPGAPLVIQCGDVQIEATPLGVGIWLRSLLGDDRRSFRIVWG